MSDSTSSSAPDNTQKALITVGVLGGCIIFALVVAKIVDYCYDHHIAVNDDASDISENTRNLIRSRIAVNAFRKNKKNANGPSEISAKQRKIIRIWSAKAKESRRIAEKRRAEEQAKALAARADLIIKVEEATGEAKLQSPLDSASATLTLVSEKGDNSAGPSNEKSAEKTEKGKGKSKFPIQPELKRTLTGLDSSNTIAETPVTVAPSASGKTSILPGKEGTSQPSTNQETVRVDGDAVDTSRSQPEAELAAQTDRTAQSASPDTRRSNSSKRQESGPQGAYSPKPGGSVSKSPGPKTPTSTPKAKSPDPQRPKTGADKSPGPAGNRSPSPNHKPVQQPAQSRSPSPTRVIKETKKEVLPSPAKQKSPEPSKSPTVEALGEAAAAKSDPAESPNKDASPGDKTDSQYSPTRPGTTRPTSSLSSKFFTVVRPTDRPTNAKSASPSPESRAPPSPGKSTPHTKPRPKSYSAKDKAKLDNMPTKLAGSVALYGRATGDLDKHKALVSKKRATVSPSGPANQTASLGKKSEQASSTGKKPEQSPIVVAAAARKARTKSAKS